MPRYEARIHIANDEGIIIGEVEQTLNVTADDPEKASTKAIDKVWDDGPPAGTRALVVIDEQEKSP